MKTKGRAAPPKNPTIEAMAEQLQRPGLYILEFRHNDGCPTIKSQRWEHCTCGDDVDHYLVPFAEMERGAE